MNSGDEDMRIAIINYGSFTPFDKFLLLASIRFCLNMKPVTFIKDIDNLTIGEFLRLEQEIGSYANNTPELFKMIMRDSKEKREAYVLEELRNLENSISMMSKMMNGNKKI